MEHSSFVQLLDKVVVSVGGGLGEGAIEGALEAGADPGVGDETGAADGLGVVASLAVPDLGGPKGQRGPRE